MAKMKGKEMPFRPKKGAKAPPFAKKASGKKASGNPFAKPKKGY